VTSPSPQTRGFLFADLRGYTAFTEQHGDQAAAELLGRYRALVRREIATFHGAEIRTEGDSLYVVFNSVSQAVQAGLAIRDAAAASTDHGPIHVGIGVHAGEATDGEQGIVSSAVNVAARVCSAARPGELLVTDTVRSLTRTFLAVKFTPVGRRRLKGIREPIHLFRVDPVPATSAMASARSRSRWWPPAIAMGAAVVAVTAVALTSGIVFRGVAAGPTDAGNATSPSPSPDRGLGRFQDAGPFPNTAEQAILDGLPSEITSSCERPDPETRPEFYFPPVRPNELAGTMTLATRAGVSCLTGQVRVVFWQASASPGGAEELVFNRVAKLDLAQGSCERQARAFEAWSAGAHTGHLLCFVTTDAEAILEWSYADANVYAVASRRDGDRAALYDWWYDVGRLLSR
jgi:class 3 adenylate cyclase